MGIIEFIVSSFSQGWLRWMIAMSWQVALLVVVVFAVSLLTRRSSPRFQYALWGLVLLKLCLPPTLSFFTGIGRVLPAPSFASVSNNIQSAETPAEDIHTVAEKQPATEPSGAISGPLDEPKPGKATTVPLFKRLTPAYISLPFILFCIWIMGMIVAVVTLASQYVKIRRYIIGSRTVTDEAIIGVLDRAKALLGIKFPVWVIESQAFFSPMLLGIYRPCIILPAGVLENLKPQEALPIFLHELAHYKRKDLLMNWVQVILQIVYWFHPLVSFVNFGIRKERELIVDDIVLAKLEGNQVDYGNSLVQIVKLASRKKLFVPGYIGILERAQALQKRLMRILNTDRKLSLRFPWSGYAILLILALIFIPQAKPYNDEIIAVNEYHIPTTFTGELSVGPVVNLGIKGFGPEISKDGLTMYYTLNRQIWFRTRTTLADPWSEPTKISLSTSTNNDPSVSSDELTMYYATWSGGGYGNYDLWKATRLDKYSPWGNATNLGSLFNSNDNESAPEISADGLTLFYCYEDLLERGPRHIWYAERPDVYSPWSAPRLLAEIGTDNSSTRPSISSDGLILLLDADWPGTTDNCLWYSVRASVYDPWSPRMIVMSFGAPVEGYYPDISFIDNKIYFALGGNIYSAEIIKRP